MFRKLLESIRQVVRRIFPKKSIQEAMRIDISISDAMTEAIELWGDMYENKSPWLDEKTHSLNLASAIASELARLTTLELKSEITGGQSEGGKVINNERAEFLNTQYQKVIHDIRREVEYAAAKGGLVFKPYIDGDNIAVDYVQADAFFPVRFDSAGNIIAIIFTERIKEGKKVYTRLEYHDLRPEGYYIANTAYVNETGDETLGVQIPLTAVDAWANLQPEALLTKVKKPLFAYLKMPMANIIDTKSPLGVSVYARATDLIEQADKQYSRILWEYEGSELALNVAADLFKVDGSLPEGKERLYRKLDTDAEDFYQEWAPQIRDESLFNGLNKLLQRIEFACGLAYGTLSDVQLVDKTAEEIRSSKQRSYSTVVDIQKNLENSLIQLIYAMDIWTTIGGLAPKGSYEVSFEFDDSLVVDAQAEQAILLQEVAAGLIKPEMYLMRRYGVTEEQAKEMLPSMNEPDEFDEFE